MTQNIWGFLSCSIHQLNRNILYYLRNLAIMIAQLLSAQVTWVTATSFLASQSIPSYRIFHKWNMNFNYVSLLSFQGLVLHQLLLLHNVLHEHWNDKYLYGHMVIIISCPSIYQMLWILVLFFPSLWGFVGIQLYYQQKIDNCISSNVYIN